MGLMQDNEIRQDGLGGGLVTGGNVVTQHLRRTPAQQLRFLIGFLIVTVGPTLTLVVLGCIAQPVSMGVLIAMGAVTAFVITCVGLQLAKN